MKKVIFIALTAAFLTACDKDEPVLNVKPGSVPETVVPNKPDKEQAGNEADTTPPTEAELKSYFNINTDLNVYQCLQLIKESKEEKDIQGRKLHVTASNVVSRNDEEGSFVSSVSGTVNGKEFAVEFACKGLKKKPARFYMASRVNVTWKEGVTSPESLPIPFDEFYRLKKSDKLTAEFLSQWVRFYSTSPDGSDLYDFTDEDIAKTALSEVRYDEGRIYFIVTYDGLVGKTAIREQPFIRFDKNLYYKNTVKTTKEPQYFYMQGVYEHLESFYGNFLEFSDDKVFVAEIVPQSKNCNKSNNTITCTLSLTTYQNSNEELARFEYEFKGFKPLTDLKNEWSLSTTSELNSFMSKRFASAADGDVSEQMKRYAISNWIKLAKSFVKRDGQLLELYVDKGRLNNVEVDAWIPASRRVIHADIRLLAPHFEVISSKKQGKNLSLTIELTNANEISLSGVTATLNVAL